MANLYYTFILRFSQAGLDASLTLLIGVVVSGIIRRMLGPAATRRLFGGGWRGPIRGWVAGMLLPVCSLGVIPVARELRRSGVAGGTVLAFVLTGPLLNPISFLYGLTLGEPKVILTFAGITLAKTALVAYLWNAWFGGAADAALAVERGRNADGQLMPVAGLRRIMAVLVTAARELSGRDLVYYGVGLSGNALIAVCLRHGAMQRTMAHHDHWAPLRMVFLSIPAYLSPLSGMMRIGSMFEHGNSIGAAFVLLVLGIGMSLGTLLWLMRDFGWRRFTPWFCVYVIIVLGLGYACEPLLWDSRKLEADHTHAFDDLSSPFAVTRAFTPAQMDALVRDKLAQQFGPPEQLALTCLLVLLVAGVGLRLADRSGAVERWLVARPTTTGPARFDRGLSGVVVGGTAISGLIAFSVIGAFIYYPDSAFCLDRMRYLVGDLRETIEQGHAEESIRFLEQWDLVARQMQVGVYIRAFGVTPEQAKAVDDLRETIELVRDDLRADRVDEANRKFVELVLRGPYKACREYYGPTRSRTTAGLMPIAPGTGPAGR